MASYLETKLCYRLVLFRYMDGTAANCLSLPEGNRLCCNCALARSESQKTKRTLPAPHEVGQVISCMAVAASVTPFTQLLNYMTRWVERMSGGCAKCYLEGHAPKARHLYGAFNCPTGAYDTSQMNRYTIEFKPTWHTRAPSMNLGLSRPKLSSSPASLPKGEISGPQLSSASLCRLSP
ncbi:hypothetical protein M407DRAFT_35041 [Tulasnella calospora MUT 4182]|uniref:Uncharacterized protein n=1 Tax=Tulasnella calospora MUT 4182 TaxID=1051891 RepID=A0A0C3K1W4_9AGAM|nr:hypothetical protein M407DRAFT_35041 [Tulasnella calospora MUT 4182]